MVLKIVPTAGLKSINLASPFEEFWPTYEVETGFMHRPIHVIRSGCLRKITTMVIAKNRDLPGLIIGRSEVTPYPYKLIEVKVLFIFY